MLKATPGILYFYVHFATEVLCFYFLTLIIGDNDFLWLIAFTYDFLAFVPQAPIGYLYDHFRKLPTSTVGILLLCVGLIIFNFVPNLVWLCLIIICIGNCFVHVTGAEVTLRNSKGSLSPSAIFVAGGSFGVITGKMLAGVAPFWVIVLLALSSIPFALRANHHHKNLDKSCRGFNYQNSQIPISIFICLMITVVAIRGWIGYGIPTSWNKTIIETFFLYCAMGVGKALGGIMADKIGVRKTAIVATIGALPFLLIGDNLMIISLIGVALFSMTMPITLALLVSAIPDSPGLAFGFTTIGLFLGTAPVFFVNFPKGPPGYVIIATATFVCLIILLKAIRKEKHNE